VRIPDPHKPAGAVPENRRLFFVIAIGGALALFLFVGMVGIYRYGRAFWLYRGFPPPHDPAFVQAAGRTEDIRVMSTAIGGRSQRVVVYLPPGYDHNPQRRYPVLYLLHGFPGNPDGFVLTVRVGVVEDTLLAENKLQPMIMAMPFGSTGTFTNKEWANGVRPGEGWETFVARDVVRAIDAHYRTIPTQAGRALAGLSEGGYAALNIGLHHPGEFRVLESWSGYEKASNIKSIFGGRKSLLEQNSPLLTIRKAAPALRRNHVYIWFYSGREDSLKPQNVRFAAKLRRLRVRSRFFLVSGGHNWALWRNNAWQALALASERLAHA
jgi:enterochelin esterase-like enzyme